jgi:AcrR family transcriptional regulator
MVRSPKSASPARALSPPDEAPPRLSRGGRFESLLDVAAQLLKEGGLDAVTMDAVAARAGVSRPLVYKHFSNRQALLAGLWRREAKGIDAAAANLRNVHGVEAITRRSVEATLNALDRRSLMLAPLLHSELFDPELRREQATRQRRIRRWWTKQVIAEFGLSETDAEAAVTVHFAGLDSMLAEFSSNPKKRDRDELVDVYVCLVMGGLRALQARSKGGS